VPVPAPARVPVPARALPRRAVLAAACGTCAAAVTGCATYGPGGATAPPAAAPPAAPAPADAPATDPTASSGLTAVSGIPVADLPVGGGTVFADRDLVVVRPSDTEIRAFSATCTHQGCAVGSVADGAIVCPCHGSTFSVQDGRPLAGPATQPLAERNVTVRDGVVEIV
jgi:Rieske Fe-S protein